MRNKPYPLYDIPPIGDLKEMVRNRAKNTPDATAFTFSKGKNEICSKTCSEFGAEIDALGTYLYSIGLMNKHIAVLGENSYEWIVAFLAVTNGGNVVVALDKEQPPEMVEQLLSESDCSAVIYSPTYENSVRNIRGVEKLPISDIEDYIAEGKRLILSGNTDFIDYSQDQGKVSAIFFTSGTTGSSKGVMLSQRNIAADINSASRNFFLAGDTIAVLPFHHTFGLITAVFMPFNYGHSVFINKSLKTVQRDFVTAKPQTTFFVPLFVETFYKQIWITAQKSGKEKTLRRAMKISDFLLKIGIDVRKKLFKSVYAAFGGELEFIICGGAVLNEKYVREFRSWGISILNGYGITECAPVVSVNRNAHWRDGSVGLIIDCCKVRISEDGEVLVKGDNVMLGYYKDEKSTAEAMRDGWYATGDLGYMDDENFLYLTGRKKNLIILSNGENVSPEEIERELLSFEEIQEVVVYSDNKVITAEIFPTDEYMGNDKHFKELVKVINRRLPSYKQINKIKLRSIGFEKNSTRKILRHKIKEDTNNG